MQLKTLISYKVIPTIKLGTLFTIHGKDPLYDKLWIEVGRGGEIISPIGAVRRLLPSASLWETLGQGQVPT